MRLGTPMAMQTNTDNLLRWAPQKLQYWGVYTIALPPPS